MVERAGGRRIPQQVMGQAGPPPPDPVLRSPGSLSAHMSLQLRLPRGWSKDTIGGALLETEVFSGPQRPKAVGRVTELS